VGDFNGDGHQDLAVASSTYWGEVRVLLGNGDGTFQTAGTFAEGPYRNSVAVGEFNGDGRQDLAVAADDAVYLLVGNGDGTFQTARNVGRGGLDVAPGDFNRDGVSDLAVVEGSGGTRVLLGNGDGTFRTRPVTYMAGASPEALAVEDLDADGWADLAVVNVDSHDVSILRNDGTWTTSVTINQAVGQEDPTAGPTISFDVIFSGPVTGFDAADVDLGASTVGGTLVPAVTGSGSVYTVAVTGMTGSGTVVARIPAGAAMDGSGQATLASISTDNSVTFHSVSPTVTVNQDAGQADPTNTNPIVFLVQFSEPVAGFGTGSVTPGGTLAAFAAVTGVSLGAAPNSYLVAVTVSGSQTGTVTASVAAGAVTDVAGNGNAASTSTDNTVTFDNVPPTATVTPPGGGGGTVGGTAVVFAVAFSEPVVGFTAADVDLAGTTAPGAAASLTDSGDHTHFTVTVTGMATSGTVDVTVDAGVVTDPAGNPNDGSNTGAVDYVHSGSLQFSAPMYSVNEQGAPVLAVTVTRAGGSDGPLSVDYATADGSAVAGADYTAVSGTLSWAAGDAADQTIQIPIPDDGGFEADGAFAVNLSNVSLSGALGSPATATVNVYEEAGLTFAAAAFAGAEGAGADFVVKRTLDTHGVVTIDYATGDGTATAASGDYTPTRGTLTWADGDTADKTVHVAIAADGINEGRETINLTLSSPTGNAQAGPRAAAPITIAPSDGVTIAGSSKITKSTFADADGDRVTVALGGKAGTLTYFLTNGRGPIAEIDLAGTVTLKSTATISVKKPKGGTGDKRVGIGEVDGSGFKSFTAKAGDLTGAGFNLSGYAGSITVGNVENGADFLLPGAVPAAKPRSAVTITAGVIGDGTDITVAARVKSITAIAIGQGTITAPSIGAIKVKGRAATKTVPAISGDFKSDVTISGVGVDPVKGKALGALNVKGIVSDVAIAVAGNVGAAVVGAFRDSRLFAGYAGPDDGTGTFNFPATVGTFRATGKSDGFEDSRVIATAFRAVTITDLDSADPAGPFGFYAHASLGAVTVVGPTKWKYDPARPTPQGLGDFVVQVV
jgi:hypothetical protein